MYCEKTSDNPEKFSFQDLTRDDVEMLMEGLVELKSQKLIDPEAFKDDRRRSVDLYYKMDHALVHPIKEIEVTL